MGTTAEFAIFKCRKCRHILFTDVNVVSAHNEHFKADSIANGLSCDNKSLESVWFLQEENVTDWLKEQLNHGEWIKGKISCPKCFGKIGSFDFISGSQCPCKQTVLPSLHVVRSKVDYEPIKNESMDTHLPVGPNVEYSETDSFDILEKKWEEDLGQHDLDENSKPNLPKNEEHNDNVIKLRKSKQHSINCKSASPNSYFSDHYLPSSETLETAASENFSNLVCPICLDVYLSPFTCQPCGHVFCEICLRKIAKSNPTHTYCPICRQLIGRCELNREVSQAVRLLHPVEYKVRLHEEDKDCRRFPLPYNSKYHPDLHSFGRDYGYNGDEAPRTTWLTFFSGQQQTFAILLSLKVISAGMFFLGFFGGSYVKSFLKYVASFAPQTFQEIIEIALGSNNTVAD